MVTIGIYAGSSVSKINEAWRRGRFLCQVFHLSVRNSWTNNKHLKNAIESSSTLDDTSPRAFMVAAVLHFIVLLSSRMSGELVHGPLKMVAASRGTKSSSLWWTLFSTLTLNMNSCICCMYV